MNSFTKTASAVALAVGLAAPFSAEAGGEYYPYGAYRARHGDHHHGHHGGRDGSYTAGVVTGVVAGALLGIEPPRAYYRPAPVYVAPRPVYVPPQPVYGYQERVYVPAPRVPTRPNICDDYNLCDDYNRCAPAYREVVIEGMRCRANDFAAQCPNGQRFALDAN
jgi:hypothetical protein